MRIALTIMLFTAVGCGSKNNDNNTPDQGVSTGGDMAVPTNGGKDMTAGSTACDIGKQTGCAAGQKCVPLFGGTQQNPTITGTCESAGTVAEGAACQPSNSQTELNDDCAAGSTCDNDGANAAPICRKICTKNADCTTAGQKCFAFYDPKWGFCLPTCTAFSNECPAGNDCSANYNDIEASQSSNTGYFICKTIGGGAVGDQCMADGDCGKNLWCDFQNGCMPACDSTHSCTVPGVDAGVLTCQAFTNLANGAGYCN
jgi:hypothetical protein